MAFDDARIPTLAKLSQPVLANVYPRARLFRLLDQARKRSIVWICGPAGAGKTTLVASYLRARQLPVLWYSLDAGDNDIGTFFYYMGVAVKAIAPQAGVALPLLTPEYQGGLAAFTANYFRELFARLARPSVVVLDNFQNANDRAIQELLQQGFEQIPDGITVVAICRETLPGVFARSLAGGRITTLGWEALKLTEQESAGIVRLRRKRTLSVQQASALHVRTGGWAAGLVLLSESAIDGITGQSDASEPASQSIFDYFAYEIFRHSDSATQSFLLNTAYLPVVTVRMAQGLAVEANAEKILKSLTDRNFFTVRRAEGSFEYHPMFRDFLVSQAAAHYSAEQVDELKRRSARLLVENGEIETAIVLLQQAHDWPSAVQSILKCARTLVAQGRTQTLVAWLNSFPESFRAQHPWLLFWFGVCRLSVDPAEARVYLERAYALFEKQDDASPLYLTWSRIIDSFGLERNDFTPMRRWLDLYRSLAVGRKPPTTEIESASVFVYVNGLINAWADHPDLAIYAERAERLFKSESNDNRRFVQVITLVSCYLMKGDYSTVMHLLENVVPANHASNLRPMVRIFWQAWKTLAAGRTGDADELPRVIDDGLALAEDAGIHLYDYQILGYGIAGNLSAGNTAAARALLQRMSNSSRRGQIREGVYSQHASLVFLHEGDIARAMTECRRALDLATTSGDMMSIVICTINLAYVYAHQGNTDAAIPAIGEARQMAERMNCKLFFQYCALCEANIYRLRGDQERSLNALREALALGQEGNTVTPPYCPRDTAAILYAMALDADIYPEYVRSIIAKTRLAPSVSYHSENWPWSIRLYTLGRFVAMKDNAPLTVAGNAHKKPLELLRALAAFGGRYVGVAKLAHILWPDSEGDLAMHSFETTLYRLRKLIGEQCILTYNGQLTLNPDRCWFDVWAVEQLLDTVDKTSPQNAGVKHLADLYRGPFLEGDDSPWALVERERLRSKLLSAITQQGQMQEARGNFDAAMLCYRKGVEVDPLAEELYRYLMRCYRHLNQPANALSVYLRCRETLMSMLRIEPSAETTALHEQIKRSVG